MKNKILFIDDDLGITEATKIILEDCGYLVMIDNGAVEYMKLIKEFKPDLILLDLFMINRNGSELCQEVKKDPETKNIPVVILSASINTKQAAIEAGADGFLFKPFDMEVLVKTVNQLMN